MKIFQIDNRLAIPINPENVEARLYFDVDGVAYVAVATEADLKHVTTDISLAIVMVVKNEVDMQREFLEDRFHLMSSEDDVFNSNFLRGIVFVGQFALDMQPSLELQTFLKSLGCAWVRFVSLPPSGVRVTPGPHIVYAGYLRQVFREYKDENGAFLSTFIPTKDPDDVRELRIAGKQHQTLSAIVPSRLADPVPGPLSGIRIAVKDVFHIKGLKNSLCNRAFYQISPRAEATSPIIAPLIRSGATIVGVTKLSSLIFKEEPVEAVDYQAPFNPRGDGYQSPAGSSSGSATAIAAYNWLDFSIGTDTSGSGRRPALANGVYQFRPTHSMITDEGMIPLFQRFDTPCLFGRDIMRFEDLIKSWYACEMTDAASSHNLPLALIYPLDYFPVGNTVQMEVVNCFVKKFELWSGSAVIRVSIAREWKKCPPKEANGQAVDEFLDQVNVKTFYHDFYRNNKDFRQTYQARSGREPYVNEHIRSVWALGRQVSSWERCEAMNRLEVYKTWFLQTILKPTQQTPLVMLPIANVEPNYRDAQPLAVSTPTGFDSLYLPAILEGPDLVLPLGQFKYHSRISNTEETLPIAVNIVGLAGTDVDFVRTIARFLEDSGLPTSVSTGRTMFSHQKPSSG